MTNVEAALFFTVFPSMITFQSYTCCLYVPGQVTVYIVNPENITCWPEPYCHVPWKGSNSPISFKYFFVSL